MKNIPFRIFFDLQNRIDTPNGDTTVTEIINRCIIFDISEYQRIYI